MLLKVKAEANIVRLPRGVRVHAALISEDSPSLGCWSLCIRLSS